MGLNKKRGWLMGGMGLAALATGVFLVWWMVVWADRGLRDELLLETRLVARAVDINRVKALTGEEADLKSPHYRRIKEQFAAVRTVNPKCRFIYLLGRKADGTVFFFVDSEPAGSNSYSPAGEIYTEISAEDRRVVEAGVDLVTGPSADRWGKWVSGLVPIFDPRTGAVIAVLGMDIDARDWRGLVAARAALPAGLLLAFGLALFLFHTRSKVRQAAGRLTSAVNENEEKIQLLLNSTAEAIYGLDMNGNCTFCNKSCLSLLGYEHPGELLGKNMHRQIHSKHTDGTPFPIDDCRIFKAFKEGTGTHVDDEVLWRADGTSFPAEYWSYPQHRAGAVVGAVVTFLDITERKRAEEARDSLLKTAQDGFWLVDATTGRIVDINDAASSMLGYTREEFLAHEIVDFDAQWSPAELSREMQRCKTAGKTFFETRHRVKGGQIIDVEISVNYLAATDQFFSFIRDITGRKRLADEKLRLEERSRKLIEDVFRFIPEGILVFSRKMELLRQNQAFRELVSGYAGRLGFAEDELANLIIDKIKVGLDNNLKEIRIPRKHETGK